MPELPEVETIVRGLRPHLEGRRLVRVDQRRAGLRFPFPENFARRLEGRRVTRIGRRAKYILIYLDDGQVLLCHLGMSGRLTICNGPGGNGPGGNGPGGNGPGGNGPGGNGPGGNGPGGNGRGTAPDKHDHVILETDEGRELRFNDARRFGMMDLIAESELDSHPLLAELGPEPLGNDFNGPGLARRLAGKRSPIKAALMDQRVVAGLGNIYVCESLFLAGISPRRKAYTVQGGRAERLVRAVRDVLGRAIDAGGSSLRDYVQASGELGYFQHSWAVYGREGARCPGCTCDPATTGGIRRMVQSNRSTFYCATRQR
jgi:formamidopyrimidine-DNA glycosylase